MPYTINGIGTHYYGKRNLQKTTGICENCHQQVDLQTYETRTWFCVIFLPVIPLGKKQIFDYCPRCTTHRALPFNEWQQVTNDAIKESATNLQDDEQNPEAGLEMLQTLAAFRKTDEATKFAHILKDRHADHAQVQFAVGGWLEHVGQTDAATQCFQSAYEIEPDEPAYKRAWGMTLAERGQLNDARQILSEFEPPSKTYDPTVVFYVASQCQNHGDHAQALELYGLALDVNPEFGRDKELRKIVRQSETAIGAEQSILPARRLPKKLVGWTLALLLIVGAVVGFSMYKSQSRELIIVNGSQVAMKVQVDDEFVSVPPLTHVEHSIGEGVHSFKVIEPNAWSYHEGDFLIHMGFFERLFDSSVFVLSPAKSALIVREQNTYAAQAALRRVDRSIRVNDAFLQFNDIDYLFEEFPESIKTKSKRGVETRTRLYFALAEPEIAASALSIESTPQDAFAFIQRHLEVAPNNKQLLIAYSRQANVLNRFDKAFEFLGRGIDRRPVEIEWHRAYQSFGQRIGRTSDIIKHYDKLAKTHPDDSAVLYLRGRVEPNSTLSERYFDQAIKFDPKNFYPYYAKAHRALSIAEFATAKSMCEKALEIRKDDDTAEALLYRIKIAMGEFDDLKAKIDRNLTSNPLDVSSLYELMSILSMTPEDRKQLQPTVDAFIQTVKTHTPGDPYELIPHVKRYLNYLKQDHAAEEAEINKLKRGPERDILALQCQIGQGKVQGITVESLPDNATQRGYLEMYLYIAWLRQGQEQAAKVWLERAFKDFENGDAETQQIAKFLRAADESQLFDQIMNVSTQGTERMVVLLTASTLVDNAALQNRLRAKAVELNYARVFPHFFIRESVRLLQKQ